MLSANAGKAEFGAAYLTSLRLKDPETESHFSAYFSAYLESKLRHQLRGPDLVDDIRQETLVRVLDAVYRKQDLKHPERFGAFVNSVCNHVLLEHWRRRRSAGETLEGTELTDGRRNPESAAQLAEDITELRKALRKLQKRDRDLLRAIYWEDADRRQISRATRMSPDHVRVTLHRAKRAVRKFLDQARGRCGAVRKTRRKLSVDV